MKNEDLETKVSNQKEEKPKTSKKEEYYDASIDIFTKENDQPFQEIVTKKNTHYKYTKLSNFVLKFSRFYAPMELWKIVTITGGLAVIFGVIGVFFVKNPGIYNFGLAALGQAISKLTNTLLRHNEAITPAIYNAIDHALFWIAYLILSIPIFILGWKKVGKQFTLLTLEFLVISSLVSFLIGQIPAANQIYIIGNFDHANITENTRNAIAETLWYSKRDIWNLIPIQWNDGGNIIAQIIFSCAYGWMLAFFFAVIAIIGGSAGVTGIIGEYYSTVKHKNFGTINGYINLIIIVFSVVIGTYLAGSLLLTDINNLLNNPSNLKLNNMPYELPAEDVAVLSQLIKIRWNTALYFSPNLISTFICNFVFIIVLNQLFPKYKIVQCKIHSPHMSEIKKAIIKDKKTINSFTITEGIGGYSGAKTKVLSSITLYKQVPRLIKKVREVDKNALITISSVDSIDGNLYLPENKF
ncbi:DUF2179 domain-containing protein [Mycoplasmopsis gallinarum]